ncbi:hypothetical protein CKO16_09780 [Rhodoblastus acidophilus]|nr:hypothetical protein CKO16_09780 [Rhodoblastus acidophilus]
MTKIEARVAVKRAERFVQDQGVGADRRFFHDLRIEPVEELHKHVAEQRAIGDDRHIDHLGLAIFVDVLHVFLLRRSLRRLPLRNGVAGEHGDRARPDRQGQHLDHVGLQDL